MAMYWGGDWLESNCWYHEQPLEELGLEKPTGVWSGAKWKAALCFREEAPMYVFVVNAKNAPGLWYQKYHVRAEMATHSGNAGNSCMHLTDDQKDVVKQAPQGGPPPHLV